MPRLIISGARPCVQQMRQVCLNCPNIRHSLLCPAFLHLTRHSRWCGEPVVGEGQLRAGEGRGGEEGEREGKEGEGTMSILEMDEER